MRKLLIAAGALLALAWITPVAAYTPPSGLLQPSVSIQAPSSSSAMEDPVENNDFDQLIMGRPSDWWDDQPTMPDLICINQDDVACMAAWGHHLRQLIALQQEVQERLQEEETVWSPQTILPSAQMSGFTVPLSPPMIASAIGN